MAMQAPALKDNLELVPFSLKGTDGRVWSLDEVKGENGTVLMFICNHCPYVKAAIDRLVEDMEALAEVGIGAAAIMPNDTEKYPADSFENMKAFAKEHDFPFPYLIDETQEVARAYGAVCTPDLFGFDRAGKLAYRGRVDGARPGQASAGVKRELREAMLQVARTGWAPAEQIPSMGCSIKWRQ